jgi:hypothetical protein
METTNVDEDFEQNSFSVSLNHKFPEKIQPFQLPRLSQLFEVLPLGIRFKNYLFL